MLETNVFRCRQTGAQAIRPSKRPSFKTADVVQSPSRRRHLLGHTIGCKCLSLQQTLANAETGSVLRNILRHAYSTVAFDSELWSSKDKRIIDLSITSWDARKQELLPRFSEQVTDVRAASSEEVVVKWRIRWIPPALLWLDNLGAAWPGVTVEYFDVLERYDKKSEFKWRALFKLFATAAREGVLRVPESAMEGTYVLKLNERGQVLSISERTWLIPLFRSQRVKNRRIARDMLLWQEVRQPAGTDYPQWDDLVMATLLIDSVPGMGQFDIDGLEDSGRDGLYGDALAVMAFATVIALAFGAAYAFVYLNQMQSAADPYLLQYGYDFE